MGSGGVQGWQTIKVIKHLFLSFRPPIKQCIPKGPKACAGIMDKGRGG